MCLPASGRKCARREITRTTFKRLKQKKRELARLAYVSATACIAANPARASDNSFSSIAILPPADPQEQTWNWHIQNTDIVQGDPGFPAKYSGPASLNSQGEVQETVTLDLFAGARLWRGAEVHIDGLMWQGFGLTQTHGIEAFPNGDAYKAGTQVPNGMIARLFIRQTIGLGGEQADVPNDQLTLAGKQDISRLTLTLGRFSPPDICDNNTYAHDPHTQFMNWAMMGNIAWDYGQDTIGYTTGFAMELNQPEWALRYGFFQMPANKNGYTGDGALSYCPEKILETYYDFQICEHVHGALDYQFISDPAFNRDRGPVSVIGARLHWEF